jgi:geranylgeranyl diphosphate/geranylgeranyl-bacteriochlorophyllide a reductase
MSDIATFDVVVVGGGPSGATAAGDLAKKGWSVLLLDRAGRIKPCGGAIPPRLIADFDIPEHLIVARVNGARIFSPSSRRVDMPIEGAGYVAMVDREHFDEWMRERAKSLGALRIDGHFQRLSRDVEGVSIVHYTQKASDGDETRCVRARAVVGADGALSTVARQAIRGAGRVPYVFAYHEIISVPEDARKSGFASYDGRNCDIYYRGTFSPDFYAWIFPHGETASVGTGSAFKGFSLRSAVGALRTSNGLENAHTVRKEGAPIPLRPLRKWDNGRDVLLSGDAAGVVAPASGEGIFYAMTSGRFAADAIDAFLVTGDARKLASARRRFMREYGRTFWLLGIMQRFWYRDDKRRERFVSMCQDRDVQKLTWEAYVHKRLVRTAPMAHIRIFFKDMGHLLGLLPP